MQLPKNVNIYFGRHKSTWWLIALISFVINVRGNTKSEKLKIDTEDQAWTISTGSKLKLKKRASKRDGSQDTKLPLHASHVALPT